MNDINLRRWIICEGCLKEKISNGSNKTSVYLKKMALKTVLQSKKNKKDWKNPVRHALLMDSQELCPSCSFNFEHMVLGGATEKNLN